MSYIGKDVSYVCIYVYVYALVPPVAFPACTVVSQYPVLFQILVLLLSRYVFASASIPFYDTYTLSSPTGGRASAARLI